MLSTVLTNKKSGPYHLVREISFEELEKCLTKDCIELQSIKTFDFQSFDKIVRQRKGKDFDTEEEYQAYKREILSSTQNGTCDIPKINVQNEKVWQVMDGKIRLLAYKVLGINPVVEFSLQT